MVPPLTKFTDYDEILQWISQFQTVTLFDTQAGILDFCNIPFKDYLRYLTPDRAPL